MPHLIVEYSANLDDEIKLKSLFNKLHDAALETGVFPLGGIRFRSIRCEDYLIGDGDDSNAFVHLLLKLGHGRDFEVKKEVGEKLFSTLTQHFDEEYAKRPLAISFEIVEFDEVLNYKKNNIHEHIKMKRN